MLCVYFVFGYWDHVVLLIKMNVLIAQLLSTSVRSILQKKYRIFLAYKVIILYTAGLHSRYGGGPIKFITPVGTYSLEIECTSNFRFKVDYVAIINTCCFKYTIWCS